MTEPKPETIEIDRKRRVQRRQNQWTVEERDRDGVYQPIDSWEGNRRSLLRWFDDHAIFPTREAIDALQQMPERYGFRDTEEPPK